VVARAQQQVRHRPGPGRQLVCPHRSEGIFTLRGHCEGFQRRWIV
jgi:hypothetical protein